MSCFGDRLFYILLTFIVVPKSSLTVGSSVNPVHVGDIMRVKIRLLASEAGSPNLPN